MNERVKGIIIQIGAVAFGLAAGGFLAWLFIVKVL